MSELGNEEFPPIPRGATYTRVRRRLAGLDEHGVDVPNDLSDIRNADRLLQTAECVGGLACCEGCQVQASPCPVARDERLQIFKTVWALPVIPGVPSEGSVWREYANAFAPILPPAANECQ